MSRPPATLAQLRADLAELREEVSEALGEVLHRLDEICRALRIEIKLTRSVRRRQRR